MIYEAVYGMRIRYSNYLTAINENGYVTNVKLIDDEIHGDYLTGFTCICPIYLNNTWSNEPLAKVEQISC